MKAPRKLEWGFFDSVHREKESNEPVYPNDFFVLNRRRDPGCNGGPSIVLEYDATGTWSATLYIGGESVDINNNFENYPTPHEAFLAAKRWMRSASHLLSMVLDAPAPPTPPRDYRENNT